MSEIPKPDTSNYQKCRKMMQSHEKHHAVRAAAIFFLMLFNLYMRIMTRTFQQETGGFPFTLIILLYCLMTLLTVVFSAPQNSKICMLSICLILLGIPGTCISVFFAFPMLLFQLTAIPESKQALWLKEQPGYPHFSERLDEQMEHFGKEYQPEYHFDGAHDAEMPDISNAFSQDMPEQTNSQAPVMPDAFEEFEQLQERNSQ